MKQQGMTLKKIWMLAAILLCGFSFTACTSDEDNPAIGPNPAGQRFFSSEINRLIDINYQQVKQQGYGELIIPSALFDHSVFAIPADAASDMDYVINAGYRAYVNGGSVRDAVLGVPPNDADFTTDATPEQLVEIVPNTKIYTTPSGYVVAQAWHGDDRTDMGTIHAIYPELRGKPGIPPSQSEGPYTTVLLEDTYTRDLTINSLYYDYKTGDIIDYHGGLHDLREGIIQTIYNPELEFTVNPSAMLRTVRFAGRFGFRINEAVDMAIRKLLPNCDVLGAEGIAYDLTSCFHDGAMARTYSLLKDYGILARYFLVLKDVLDTPEYNDYIIKAYTDLDAQQCKDEPTNLGVLFLPVVEKAMGAMSWTEENIARTWNELEESSGQKNTFSISDKNKAAMFHIWAQQHPKSVATGFYTDEINSLVDANYAEVLANGHAELTIPATMYDTGIFRYAAYHDDVMRALNALGYKTYINGGAVRDAVLGTEIHDLDFTTDATPEQMLEQLTGFDVTITSTASGPIAQAHHANGDWTDMVPMHGKNLLEDTYTRDLSINSMYYDYETGNIIDYHGGLHDLREHAIRTVYDANEMYPINPSALIRTVRFAARYGFYIDDYTAKAISDNMHYCEEKITGPLNNYYVNKGFGDGCATRTWQYYTDYGFVNFFMPMLKGYAGTDTYESRLKTTLNYLEGKTKLTAPLAMAAIFLPVLEKALSGTEKKTLENITAKWDELETNSGQKARFGIDDYSGDRTAMLNTFYVYFALTSGSLSPEALDQLKSNPSYNNGALLVEAYSQI